MAGASVSAGAAFLAACGGGDDGGSTGGSGDSGDAPGLLTPIKDTTNSAKQGGVYNSAINADLHSLDPNLTTSGSAIAPHVYSRLYMYEPGKSPDGATGDVIPDVAESSEISPDGLTITTKLKKNVKFDQRAPTNGRALTAADVKFSWERFAANNSSRGEVVRAVAPNAPIEGFEALDDYTIRWKFATPVANALSIFAFQRYMWLMPVEAEGGFDSRQDSRGSSAWNLTKWEPSVGFTYERNPNWHLKAAYLDGLDIKIIPEYASRRAQLEAGGLWTTTIRSEDILDTKQTAPGLNMYAAPFPEARRHIIGFSYLPDSPFHDVRVRRAVSMLIERDPWIDAFYNVSNFESEGLEVDARWDSHYMAGEPPFWIDPKGTGLGEGAKFFQFNPAEAKKLIEASGVKTPMKLPGAYSTAYQVENQVQSLSEMLNGSGMFDITLSGFDNQTYNQTYHHAQGKHEGLVMGHSMCQSGDINNHISCRYAVGSGTRVVIPEVYPWYTKAQDLMVKQRSEMDPKKRLTILNDLQKELALQMPTVPWPGAANGFSLAWPFMGNYGILNARSTITAPSEVWPAYWYDQSKA